MDKTKSQKTHYKRIIIIFLSVFFIICFLLLMGVNTASYKGEKQNIIHFSIDDSIDFLYDISSNNYNSIFDNKVLKSIKNLHEKYGLKVSFYCFYENQDFSLKDFPENYLEEFGNNSDWMRFGFHARNYLQDLDSTSAYEFYKEYSLFETEVNRFAGNKSIDNYVRLSMFSVSDDITKSFCQAETIKGLYTADDRRISYNLPFLINGFLSLNDLIDYNGIKYIHTDIRLEKTEKTQKRLIVYLLTKPFNNRILEVFTHEWAIDENAIDKIEDLCVFAKEKKYIWAYPNDVYL